MRFYDPTINIKILIRRPGLVNVEHPYSYSLASVLCQKSMYEWFPLGMQESPNVRRYLIDDFDIHLTCVEFGRTIKVEI